MIKKAETTDLADVINLMRLFIEDQSIGEGAGEVVEVTSEFLLSHDAYSVQLDLDKKQNALGMITLATIFDEAGGQKILFLENLFVKKGARSKKVASRLVEYSQTQGADLIGVAVAESGLKTVGIFFENLGFTKADKPTEKHLVDMLKKLPLERGAEGPLTYFTYRKH